MLSTAQSRAVNAAVAARQSCFVTGPGGSGKTLVLKSIVAGLRSIRVPLSPREASRVARNPVSVSVEVNGAPVQQPDDSTRPLSVFATATTGVASLLAGGSTLHSFAGLGQESTARSFDELFAKVPAAARARVRSADALVIDEVSMLTPSLFENLDLIARKCRKEPLLPFGGLQMILFGDFFQLPPVLPNHHHSAPTFCFETASWRDLIGCNVFELDEHYRQTDNRLIQLLSRLRRGQHSPEDIHLLSARLSTRLRPETATTAAVAAASPDSTSPGPSNNANAERIPVEVKNTYLFARRYDADAVNQRELQKLPGEAKVFESDVGCNARSSYDRHILMNRVRKRCLAPETLTLKRGAQVMLLVNLDPKAGLMNGSRGVVVGFASFTGNPVVEFSNGVRAIIKPHVWTINGAVIEPKPISEVDQANAKEDDSSEVDLDYELAPGDDWEYYTGSMDSEDDSIAPQEERQRKSSIAELAEQHGGRNWEAALAQLPLQLAWATTIHKSQGSTIDRLTVDLGRSVFTHGQAYVALSRARTLDGLEIIDLDPSVITAHPKVVDYYNTLASRKDDIVSAKRASKKPATVRHSSILNRDIIEMCTAKDLSTILRSRGVDVAGLPKAHLKEKALDLLD